MYYYFRKKGVKMATAESLNNVLEMFKSLDVDGDGKLTAQELKSSKKFIIPESFNTQI